MHGPPESHQQQRAPETPERISPRSAWALLICVNLVIWGAAAAMVIRAMKRLGL